MSRKVSNLLDFGIEEETDPNIKLNSLISVTVSTVMCIAAKCPLPKSNVETTKQFLSSVTNDNNKNPRNIKGFLSLLNNYTGPYEDSENSEEKEKEKSKPPEKKSVPSLESIATSKSVMSQIVNKEEKTIDGQTIGKRSTRTNVKKTEKEHSKKTGKNLLSKSSPSKSTIVSKI